MAPMKFSKTGGIFVFLLTAGFPAISQADIYLSDSTVAVAQHNKRRSSFTFTQGDDSDVSAHWGLLFSDPLAAQDERSGFVSYKPLTQCKKSEVQLREVFNYTPSSDQFDVVFYDENNIQQLKRAKNYPARAIPYAPALMRDTKTKELDRWQVFARFVQVKCLPTRFHFTYVGSKRYIAYRTGDRAWEP